MTLGRRPPVLTAQRDVVGHKVPPGTIRAGDFTYSVIELATEKAGGDKRVHRRVRTHLREATVQETRGRALVDCRIRDLSRTGARLQLDRERRLPKVFLLREGATCQSYWATLVWQVGRDAGVKLKLAEDQRPA